MRKRRNREVYDSVCVREMGGTRLLEKEKERCKREKLKEEAEAMRAGGKRQMRSGRKDSHGGRNERKRVKKEWVARDEEG